MYNLNLDKNRQFLLPIYKHPMHQNCIILLFTVLNSSDALNCTSMAGTQCKMTFSSTETLVVNFLILIEPKIFRPNYVKKYVNIESIAINIFNQSVPPTRCNLGRRSEGNSIQFQFDYIYRHVLRKRLLF